MSSDTPSIANVRPLPTPKVFSDEASSTNARARRIKPLGRLDERWAPR